MGITFEKDEENKRNNQIIASEIDRLNELLAKFKN